MKVKLKQTADEAAASIGLGKYGRSVLPGTFQMLQPAQDASGRWITGLDEDSPRLRKELFGDEYIEAKQKIKEERESLEEVTGYNLKATSDFWNDYRIRINGDRMFDLDVPADRIEYKVLIANEFAAPNQDVVNEPQYSNVKFYISRTEEEESSKAKVKKERNNAIYELTKVAENKNRLLILAKYLYGNQISDDATMDSLYNLLSDYIVDDKKGTEIRKFNVAVNKTTEELQIKIVVDEADKAHIIRQRDGNWQRGNITLGKTLAEAVNFLSKIENSNELASIMEEVRERRILSY